MASIRPTEYQITLLRNFGFHVLAPLLVGGAVFNYQKGKLPFRWAIDTQYALIATLVTEVAMVAAKHLYFMQKGEKEEDTTPPSSQPSGSSPPASELPPTASGSSPPASGSSPPASGSSPPASGSSPTASGSSPPDKGGELDEEELKEGIQASIKTLADSWGKGLNHKLIELLSSPPDQQDTLLGNLEKQIQEMRDSLPKEESAPVVNLLKETERLMTEIKGKLQELSKLRKRVGGVVSLSKKIYGKLQQGLEDGKTLDKEGVQAGLVKVEEQLHGLVDQEDMTESLISQVSETEKQLEEAKALLAILSEDMAAEIQHHQNCLDVEEAFIEKLEDQLGSKLKPKPSDGNCLFSSLEEFSDQYPEKDGGALRKDCVTKALKGLENSPHNFMIRLQVEDAMNIGRFEGYPDPFREKLEELKNNPEEAERYLSEENEQFLVGEYWEAMKTPKSFGGEFEMRIIAELLNVHIVVYQGEERVPEGKIKPTFVTEEICDPESGLLKENLGKPVVSLFRYGSQDHYAPFIKTNP